MAVCESPPSGPVAEETYTACLRPPCQTVFQLEVGGLGASLMAN